MVGRVLLAGRVSTYLKLAFLSDLNGILWLYKLIWIMIDNSIYLC